MVKFKVDPNADINGTSLKGYVTANYAKLVELFGESRDSDEYKVSGEWTFSDDEGNVFTLYDWKETSLYDSSLPSVAAFRQQDKAEFHVGGRGNAADFIDFLNEVLNK